MQVGAFQNCGKLKGVVKKIGWFLEMSITRERQL